MAAGKKGCLICFILVGALMFFLYPSVKRTHDQLVTLDEGIKAAWTRLEGLLQRRMDFVPNYIETVKAQAPHEQDVFGAVTRAHLKAATALTRPNKIAANNDLTIALGQLQAVPERYPDLKADQNFIRLRDELDGIENSIADECLRYNEAIKEYNAYRQGFPADIVAALSGFGKAFPLEIPEKAQGNQRSGAEPSPSSSSAR
ncbi:MAG: LemA family protein [Desulfobacterales bacterium]|nr:LemA family protein [Desulfobacterales bacterium]